MENVEDAGIFICTNALNQKRVEYGKKKNQTLLFALLYINMRVCCDQALHKALVSKMITLQPSSVFAAPSSALSEDAI